MDRTRLFKKLETKSMALGCLTSTGSANIPEVLAFAGLDWFQIDHMFTEIDWATTSHMIRAAKLAGITPIVRVSNDPWVSSSGTNPSLYANVLRALGVGAEGVCASISTAQEARAFVELGRDWHRGIHLMPFTRETFPAHARRVAENTLMIPLVESLQGLEQLDEITAVPGLKVITVGVSDISKELGYPFDYEHDAVWRVVDRFVATADKYGVVVGANTGYECRTPEAKAKRIGRLCQHGIKVIHIQTAEFLLQLMAAEVVKQVTQTVPM